MSGTATIKDIVVNIPGHVVNIGTHILHKALGEPSPQETPSAPTPPQTEPVPAPPTAPATTRPKRRKAKRKNAAQREQQQQNAVDELSRRFDTLVFDEERARQPPPSSAPRYEMTRPPGVIHDPPRPHNHPPRPSQNSNAPSTPITLTTPPCSSSSSSSPPAAQDNPTHRPPTKPAFDRAAADLRAMPELENPAPGLEGVVCGTAAVLRAVRCGQFGTDHVHAWNQVLKWHLETGRWGGLGNRVVERLVM